MSDTRWAKVTGCLDCPHLAWDMSYCLQLELFVGDAHELPPDCPLPHLGDIPEVRALVEAARALYLAGTWKCATIDEATQDILWRNLRDALGLPPGTATAALAKFEEEK